CNSTSPSSPALSLSPPPRCWGLILCGFPARAAPAPSLLPAPASPRTNASGSPTAGLQSQSATPGSPTTLTSLSRAARTMSVPTVLLSPPALALDVPPDPLGSTSRASTSPELLAKSRQR
ncbi:hypothetical protein C8R45DRAFT_1127430, partial [Mycena sanguinolenta]